MVEKDEGSRNKRLQRDHILDKQIPPGIIDSLGKGAFIEDRPMNYLSCKLMYGISSTLNVLSLLPAIISFQENSPFSRRMYDSNQSYRYLFDSSYIVEPAEARI